MEMKSILVTGGLGFIGGNFTELISARYPDLLVINLDKETYAANASIKNSLSERDNHIYIKSDVCDQEILLDLLIRYEPSCILNFAAETHVDNSIAEPFSFVQTNVIGTYSILSALRRYREQTSKEARLVQISTDEVFGDNSDRQAPSKEHSNYMPSSPYSSTKACADMLIKGWSRTYNMTNTIIHCSNNFGPFQNSEKFIPKCITSLLAQKKIPIYGDGQQTREWTFVLDYVEALIKIIGKPDVIENINVSSRRIRSNIEIVKEIYSIMHPHDIDLKDFGDCLEFVDDRPGHDVAYSLDTSVFQKHFPDFSWSDHHDALTKTVNHYCSSGRSV